jgi:hypothetical protein
VADDEVAGLTATFEIRAASLSLQRDLRALVLAFTPDEKQKFKVSQDATDKVFREQMAKLDAALQSPDERQKFDKLQAANKAWAEVRKAITESAAGRRPAHVPHDPERRRQPEGCPLFPVTYRDLPAAR